MFPSALWKPHVILCVLCAFAVNLFAANAPLLNDAKEGAALAERLRSLAPTENARFQGSFEIEREGAEERVVPMAAAIVLTSDGWRSIYSAQTERGVERLTILHAARKPAIYTYELPGRGPLTVGGDAATNAFAGTHFALLDLGLEFLHWPRQVLLTREMRKGRGCHVLESRPASPAYYGRVVSWIDEETSGVLMAEAYDTAGKLRKQFEVRHFKKVAGQWQVEEMELRNRQTKGSTRLRFNFDAK